MPQHPSDFHGWECVYCHDHDTEELLEIHVIPLGDMQEHDLSSECWCQPLEDIDEDGAPVWVHNSADNREAYERGLRKPN